MLRHWQVKLVPVSPRYNNPNAKKQALEKIWFTTDCPQWTQWTYCLRGPPTAVSCLRLFRQLPVVRHSVFP